MHITCKVASAFYLVKFSFNITAWWIFSACQFVFSYFNMLRTMFTI